MTTDTTWQAGAACKGKWDLFYAPAGPEQDFDFAPALALCREECPVRKACRVWAIAVREIDHRGRAVHGVVAGLAPPPLRVDHYAGTPTMRRCELESCGRLFMGKGTTRYCANECFLAARAGRKRASRERIRRAS